MLKSAVAACALLSFLMGSANALPVKLTFQASDFTTGAPAQQVSGTIHWQAASKTASIDSLTSIDMTINGHAYSISEIGFGPFGNSIIIGGKNISLNGIFSDTDDFWIIFNLSTPNPQSFAYASSQKSGIWFSSTFDSFSISAANVVPEPGSLALIAAPLLGLVLNRRYRHRA